MHSFAVIARVLGVGAACLVACTTKGEKTTVAPEPTPGALAVCPAKDATATTKGPTIHEGEVKGTETWTAEGSPHVVKGDVNVRDGAKLTIAPCAVVQLAAATSLNVAYPLTPNQGELIAEGTSESPIRIEGQNGARWNRIFVHAPGTARFANVTLVGGGGGETPGDETIGVTGDGALPRKPLVFVDHVTIQGSRGAGMRLDDAAAFMPGSRDLTVTGSGQGNVSHPYPLELGESAIDSLPTGTFTGNSKDEIKLDPETVSGGGGFKEDTTMHQRGVPYHVGETAGLDDLRVGDGKHDAVLNIEAGVKILFEAKTVLGIEGHEGGSPSIRALGTADAPIVFTSAASAPMPGDWRGLYFNGPNSGQNTLEHVRIEYTGADCNCSLATCSAGVSTYEGAIVFAEEPKTMFLKDSVIAHGAGHGVVQGYVGVSRDWKESNTFDDVAGCPVTLAVNPDTSCPEPRPACK